MSATQEELVTRLGLDTSQFEKRLRESETIARQYGQKIGAALNTGSNTGSTPQSWSSLGNLSQLSQQSIKGGGFGGITGGLRGISGAAGAAGVAIGVFAAAFKLAEQQMRSVWQLARDADVLQVSSGFMLTLSKAAHSVGEEAEEATAKLMKFETLIGNAQAGSKEATDALKALGIEPWGKTMEEAILEAADAFEKIKDPAEKARLANEAFGRGGMKVVDVLEALSKKSKDAQYQMLEQEDLDILAAGWVKIKSVSSSVTSSATDYAKILLADLLRLTGFVKQPAGKALERIGKPEKSAEELKREAEDRRKAEEDTAKAKRDYLQALEDEGSLQDRITKHKGMQWHWEFLMRDLAKKGLADTKEFYEAGKKMLDEKRKTTDLEKQQQDARNRSEEKLARFNAEYNKLLKERANIEKDAAQAKSDRAGWTIDKLLQGPLTYTNGQADVPPELIQQIQRFMGRGISRREYNEMSANYEQAYSDASRAQNSFDAARAFRLLMPGSGMDKFATGQEMKWRSGIGALTKDEQNPLASFGVKLDGIKEELAELVASATKEGIIVKPRNGK